VYDSRFIAAVDARAFYELKGRYCAFGVGGFSIFFAFRPSIRPLSRPSCVSLSSLLIRGE
jgi:hypothetical protein